MSSNYDTQVGTILKLIKIVSVNSVRSIYQGFLKLRRLTNLKVELQQQSRKYNCLLEMETHMREERDEIFKNMYSTKFAKEQELVGLRKLNVGKFRLGFLKKGNNISHEQTIIVFQNELKAKLQNKETSASASINKNEHEKVVNDLNDFIIKYREVQYKQIVLVRWKTLFTTSSIRAVRILKLMPICGHF